MSQLKENKPPAARSSGPKLVTNFNDFMSQAASTATDRSAAPSKTSKPASTAEKTRQQKILDILGDPTPQGKGKNTDAGWKLPSTSAHASSSREGPLPASLHQSQATQRDTNLPRMFNVAQPSLYKPTIPAGPSQRPRAPPSSRPSAGKAQAVSASQDAKFPCPYDDCKRGFRSLKDLRQHKLDEHDFCKVCDEDFEDFDALHKHKIVSERHITCTVCSVDFQSETGRDRHYTQVSTQPSWHPPRHESTGFYCLCYRYTPGLTLAIDAWIST